MSFPLGQLPELAIQCIYSALTPQDALSLALVQKNLRQQFFQFLNQLGERLGKGSEVPLYTLYLAKYRVTGAEMEEICKVLRAGGIECHSGKAALWFLILKTLSPKSLSKIARHLRQQFSYAVHDIEQRREWRRILGKLHRFDLMACLADPRGHYKPGIHELESTTVGAVCELIHEVYRQKGISAAEMEKRAISLIESADPTQLDHHFLGRTLLHRAVVFNRLAEVVALLKKGVCVNKKNATGHTPLFDAVLTARKWHVDLVSDIHFSKEENFVAKKEIITQLVAYGATFYTRDNFGDTPLCFAAREGDLELVSLLLSLGADIHFKNEDGFSPLNLARRYSHAHLIPFLSRKHTLETSQSLEQIFQKAISLKKVLN